MAYPSDLVRTKNWGTEVLTDTDLEAQLDLIIAWVMAALDSSSGHAHEATSNKSQKINVATGLTVTSQAQGDALYASSASAFARLAAGTKGKCFTTGGAAANPSWEGMTTQGDVEYHDGTNRARLGAGTAGQVLKTGGAGANPSWGFPSGQLGTWDATKSFGTSYEATTDVFVCATLYSVDTDLRAYLAFLTDSSNPPTTPRDYGSVNPAQTLRYAGVSGIVKKGNYWKVDYTEIAAGTETKTLFCIPIGS